MSSRKTGPVAARGRTNVLSPFELAVTLLHWPAFHELAAGLPYAKDDPAVQGHRNRDYPKAIVLLLGVLSRLCRSLPKAEAALRPTGQWDLIRSHWAIAHASGVIPQDEPATLPAKPIRAGQWRYVVDRFTQDPEHLRVFEDAFVDAAVGLALELGHFTKGSPTNPDLSSCLFADGTELRSQCRSYVEQRTDENGVERLAAVDPQRPGQVRAWLVETDGGWQAVDPVTGEIRRKLPVDPDALASGKYGPTQSAYNVVPLSVRSDQPNSRVTLWVGLDETENSEAATILRGVERLDRTPLSGRMLGLITDKIIRGVHQVQLYQRYGIIPITKVAARSSTLSEIPETGAWSDVILQASAKKGRTVKSMVLPPANHQTATGRTCSHLLVSVDGALVEVDYDERGTNLLEVSRPDLIQVKRNPRLHPDRPYQITAGYRITCQHGDFDVWRSPHAPHGNDDGRRMADNVRLFPEGSQRFTDLYGRARNTSEGGNAHQKDAYPHKRSQANGRIPVTLDVLLYFIADNAKTWYFQTGYGIVDPILHGPAATGPEAVTVEPTAA